jgi:hypothetical protein
MNLFIYYNLIAWKIMFIFYSEGRFKIFWPSATALYTLFAERDEAITALLTMPKAHLHRAFVSVTYSDVMLAFIIL